MSWLFIFFVVLAMVIVAGQRRAFASFADRGCAGRAWLRAFPDVSKDEVRAFLRLLVDAFAIRRKHFLKFRPDDTLMEIYRALTPPLWTFGAVQMELELLEIMLQERYGISLESFWRDDLTLGEVFARTNSVQE